MSEAKDGNHFWFALQVKPRHEKVAAQALERKGFEQFLPVYRARRRWSDRVKEVHLPLFPGYAFCRFDPLNRLPVLTIPNVVHVVGFGKTPAPVADVEIASLQAIVKSGLPALPWPFLKIGQFVRIDSGPLIGVTGLLLEIKNGHRLVVSVTLLQRSVAVEIDHAWVTPVGPPPAPDLPVRIPRRGVAIAAAAERNQRLKAASSANPSA
jgi:transcription antitermination factor NusG